MNSMTDEEFRKQYHRLESAYPELYSNSTRKSAIYWQIIKYDFNFICNKISEIIKSGNAEFDFRELDKKYLDRDKIKKSPDNKEVFTLTDGFLENHLKDLGLTSLVDVLKEK